MDRIRVIGGGQLNGTIPISGAKNGALPLMIASLLTDQPVTLRNVPHLNDVSTLQKILNNHGADVTILGKLPGEDPLSGNTMQIHCANIHDLTAPYDLVRRMRASFWVLGPLLSRFGQAKVSLPGGCAIGSRPSDLFLQVLQAMGADILVEDGYVHAKVNGRLHGTVYRPPIVSVGVTHVAMMAATLAKGTTVIENAAREPEITDVASLLTAMGAKIEGAGTSVITIEGTESLGGAEHTVLPDRIEAATFAIAAAMTGGDVTLTHVDSKLLTRVLMKLNETGATVSGDDQSIHVVSSGNDIQPVDITTAPFPGFPTDAQAQFMALLTRAEGVSSISEKIFENRFMHVQELARLGAKIQLRGDTAIVSGVPKLKGAPVMATDLRASVSLVIAGLAAQGSTEIYRIYHLDRGFDRLVEKLTGVGAKIERLTEED